MTAPLNEEELFTACLIATGVTEANARKKSPYGRMMAMSTWVEVYNFLAVRSGLGGENAFEKAVELDDTEQEEINKKLDWLTHQYFTWTKTNGKTLA